MYINCSERKNKKQFVYTTCSELVVFMYWTGKLMNNLLSYCGLVDPRISASHKDLPVKTRFFSTFEWCSVWDIGDFWLTCCFCMDFCFGNFLRLWKMKHGNPLRIKLEEVFCENIGV